MTLNTFLRWTVIAAVFSLCIVPFIVSSSLFFPFIAGKNLLFRVVVEIGFAAWALLAFRDASARPRLSALFWSFVAFAGVMGLATVFSQDPWKSFWSNFERMEGYVTILHLFAYFIIASTILNTERIWKWFLNTSIAASVVVSIYAMFQFFGVIAVNQGGTRLDATLGNATYLAVYVLFHIFFAAIFLVKEPGVWKKVAYGAVVLLEFIVLYNTGTRGAVIGLLVGTFVAAVLIAFFDKAERRTRVIAASVVVAGLVLVGGFLAVKNASFVQQSPVLSRFASISFSDIKNQGRYFIWPMAVKGFEQKPILGWGQENFNYVFNANYDPRMYGQEQWFDRAHNVFLDWLIAGGILGLLSYLSLYVVGLFLLWRKASDMSFIEKSLLTGLGVAYFVHSLFVFDNIMSYILFASVLALIHFRSTRLSHPLASKAEEMDGGESRAIGAAILVALCFSLYFFNWRAYATGTALLDGLRASSVSPIQADAALKSYEEALSYDTVGGPEVIERIIEAAPRMNSTDVPIATRQKFYEIGSKALEKQLADAPGDARYELFAGVFYNSYGQNDVALGHFIRAQELSPRKQSILYALGNFYLNAKQYDKATEVFRQAYDLEISNRDAANYYAVSLVYVGKEADAKAFLKEKFGSDDMTGDLFLKAYVQAADWASVIKTLKARIAANPAGMQDRQNLAAAYVQAGDKAEAIATISEMIKLSPSFKATGEEYIRQIRALGK
ncbi:MAG: O-antigen ligase family protein [Candidatus Paceibacterota bacterium]